MNEGGFCVGIVVSIHPPTNACLIGTTAKINLSHFSSLAKLHQFNCLPPFGFAPRGVKIGRIQLAQFLPPLSPVPPTEQSFQQIDQLIFKVEKSLPAQKQSGKSESKKKSNKGGKGKKPAANYSNNEDIARFQKSNIQVSRVAEVKPLENSTKLLLIKLETSSGEKQVVAGLQEFYSVDEMHGKLVCAILNLKPAKLAGVVSEAMLLAGSAPDASGAMQVKLLEPPKGSELGDRLFVAEDETKPLDDNILPAADRVNEKQWKKAVTLLKVINGKATYADKVMRTKKGDVAVPLPDNAEIH